MRTARLLTLAVALVLTLGYVKAAKAEMTTIFGPVYVDGNSCKHPHVKEGEFSFTAPAPGKGVLVVKTWKSQGDGDGHHRRRKDHNIGIRGARIELNDQKVIKEKELRGAEELNLDIELLASNELEVKIKTCKKCEVMVSVLAESQPEPTIPLGTNQELPLGTPR